MNEELRLIPPVVSIPKCTKTAQPLTLDSRRVVVPANTFVNLLSVASHRDPKYWLSGNQANDLNDFRPERWLVKSDRHEQHDAATSESEDYGGPQGEDIASTLLRPKKGSYYPFSEGPRACLGRRFAQVEVLAVLAIIFKDYSVELAVDEFATDEEVERMPVGREERRAVWEKARRRAQGLLKDGMGTIITIQMRDGTVPLRLVRKGRERFTF